MKNFVIRLLVNALALAAAAWLVDGIQMSGGFFDVLLVALVIVLIWATTSAFGALSEWWDGFVSNLRI